MYNNYCDSIYGYYRYTAMNTVCALGWERSKDEANIALSATIKLIRQLTTPKLPSMKEPVHACEHKHRHDYDQLLGLINPSLLPPLLLPGLLSRILVLLPLTTTKKKRHPSHCHCHCNRLR